jgi:homoserine O-acetyltransferase
MLSLWALAVEHGEQAFAGRGEELEREAADATARAESLATAHATLAAQAQTLRAQLEEREAQLAAATIERARAQAERDAAVEAAQAAIAERDTVRTQGEEALRAAQAAHTRDLEELRAERVAQEAALRVEIDTASSCANSTPATSTSSTAISSTIPANIRCRGTSSAMGFGTTGTLTGVGQMLKLARPSVRIVAAEPANAAVLAGKPWNVHQIQGWAPDFVPSVLDASVIDELRPIDEVIAVLIFTGLSPDAHVCSHLDDAAPGWWESMVGPGKPIDTLHWYVVCVNSLGSCKGSTGPASINPATKQPYRLEFPALSVEDIADAAAFAVRALGIERLACVVGASMGAMTSLAFTARHAQLAPHLINISGATQAQPFAIAIRSLQREAIRSDPHWNDGLYDETYYPASGMALARKLGFITYRSAQEWNGRFGRATIDATVGGTATPFAMEFAVEGYLECQAHRFTSRFDPNAYLYLSRSIDWFDLGQTCGCSADQALAQLRVQSALVIGVESDFLFPPEQQRQIAQGLDAGTTNVTYLSLDSSVGHDAFLVDTARFGPHVAKYLASLLPQRSALPIAPQTTTA